MTLVVCQKKKKVLNHPKFIIIINIHSFILLVFYSFTLNSIEVIK